MICKIHNSYRDIVAICDKTLLGKKFEQDNFQIDVKESFYDGEEKNEQEILSIINKMTKEDATFNIVGKKSIQCALKAGIIKEKGIKTIQDIPFALVLV